MMNLRKPRWPLAIAVLAALLLPLAATAHRAKGSLTTIRHNEASGMIEVVHRIHRHDAELGIGELLGEPRMSVDSTRAQGEIALYAESHFAIINGDGGELAFELVGAEVAGDYVLVYQERKGQLPPRIAVRDDILRDVYPTQINQVNIEDGAEIHTLIFAGDDSWHRYTFGHDEAASAAPDAP